MGRSGLLLFWGTLPPTQLPSWFHLPSQHVLLPVAACFLGAGLGSGPQAAGRDPIWRAWCPECGLDWGGASELCVLFSWVIQAASVPCFFVKAELVGLETRQFA